MADLSWSVRGISAPVAAVGAHLQHHLIELSLGLSHTPPIPRILTTTRQKSVDNVPNEHTALQSRRLPGTIASG